MQKRAATKEAVTGGDFIPVLRYSTSDLPQAERYRAWSSRTWPRTAPIFRTEPFEPFDTRWESVQLGPVSFVCTEITGMRWERRLPDIRTSDFDSIVVTLMIEGRAHGDLDGRAFHQTSGDLHFHDLARPSLHVSSASRTFNIIIPRPAALSWFGTLDDLHGLVVGREAAAMLFSHASQVGKALPRLKLAQAEGLGRIFLEMLALVLYEARPDPRPRISAEDLLRMRALEEIEQRLGGRDVSVADLCRALGVSRTRLFSAFRAEGGVQASVMAQRLTRAKAALSDAARAEPVSTIAHRLGFSDAAHLSRAFRKRYGMTPSDYRRLATAGER